MTASPRFDVVLRGYDRRQVDEYVAGLLQALGRMQAELDEARRQQPPPGQPGPRNRPGQPPPPRPAPRPLGAPPPGPAQQPDVVGSFSDRMQRILQTAEEEAAEIRARARAEAQAGQGPVPAEIAELREERGVVLAELTRMRGQLEALLAAPTAPRLPAHEPTRAVPPAEAATPTPASSSSRPVPAPVPTGSAPVAPAGPAAPPVSPVPSGAAPGRAPVPGYVDLFEPASGARTGATGGPAPAVVPSPEPGGAESTTAVPAVRPRPTPAARPPAAATPYPDGPRADPSGYGVAAAGGRDPVPRRAARRPVAGGHPPGCRSVARRVRSGHRYVARRGARHPGCRGRVRIPGPAGSACPGHAPRRRGRRPVRPRLRGPLRRQALLTPQGRTRGRDGRSRPRLVRRGDLRRHRPGSRGRFAGARRPAHRPRRSGAGRLGDAARIGLRRLRPGRCGLGRLRDAARIGLRRLRPGRCGAGRLRDAARGHAGHRRFGYRDPGRRGSGRAAAGRHRGKRRRGIGEHGQGRRRARRWCARRADRRDTRAAPVTPTGRPRRVLARLHRHRAGGRAAHERRGQRSDHRPRNAVTLRLIPIAECDRLPAGGSGTGAARQPATRVRCADRCGWRGRPTISRSST